MNPYEISEYEGHDLHCSQCGAPISTSEYFHCDGMCEACFIDLADD